MGDSSTLAVGNGRNFRLVQFHQNIGSATRNGNQTTYRNHKGQVTGTSTTRGNQTIFYDSMGRQQGTATPQGRR